MAIQITDNTINSIKNYFSHYEGSFKTLNPNFN